MLAGFVDLLADFADTTSDYHDKIEVYADRISAANDISELESVIAEVMRETHNVQLTPSARTMSCVRHRRKYAGRRTHPRTRTRA